MSRLKYDGIITGTLISISVAAFVLFLWTSGVEEDKPALPYIEPHVTWEDEDNTPCAGWLLDNGGAVSICEGKTIKVRWPKPKEDGLDV